MKTIVGNRSGYVLFLILISLVLPVTLGAQLGEEEELCGVIVELSGLEDGFFDCDAPFDEVNDVAPYEARINGQGIFDGTEITLTLPETVTVSISSDEARLPQTTLYRQEGDNYQAVALNENEGLEVGGIFTTTLAVAGEYVLVFNRRPSDEVSRRAPFPFLMTAHAQEGEGEGGEDGEGSGPTIYTRNFTVTADGPPEECGSFIFDEDLIEPIEDCDNPFGAAQTNLGLALSFGGATITNGATLPILNQADFFVATGTVTGSDVFTELELWRHDGDDRVLEERTRSFDQSYRFVEPGVYTAVITEDFVSILIQTWFDKVMATIVPTAHAAIGDRTIIEFTVTDTITPPEPTGPSSVLFLPGIQASRLYQTDAFGGEDRIWEPSPNFGNDINNLAMTEAGESINDVYTKSGDAIDNVTGGVIVYETWLDRLQTEKDNGTIPDYEVMAYDWRYDVRDIIDDGIITGPPEDQSVVNPIDALVALGESAPSQKVSIIAHSNGGLLAKALLEELASQCDVAASDNREECPLLYVDQLILLGSPQTGTPQAAYQLLHGPQVDEAAEAFVLQPVKFRNVAKNIPGAHGLLPSEQYFSDLSGPMIEFVGDGSYLDQFKAAYPNGITTPAELEAFLVGNEGRGFVGPGQLALPLRLNETMVGNGLETIDILADWTAPAGIEVIEIVGTGEVTTAGFEYDTVTERPCFICAPIELTKYFPKVTLYGDQTVMARSAEGYQGSKETYYVDLQTYNLLADEIKTDDILPAAHSNLSEPADVQDLLISLVGNTSVSTSDYISQTLPVYDGYSYDGLSSHSPVNLLVEDTAGNQTGVVVSEDGEIKIVEEISGSRFYLVGSSSYLFIPSDTEYEVVVDGYAEGSFSLVLKDHVEGVETTTRFRIENATTSSSTTAVFQKSDSTFTDLAVDYDGDGQVDEMIVIEPIVVDKALLYSELRAAVASSSLNTRRQLLFTTSLIQAEQLGSLSTTYRFIAKLERKVLQQHIAKLKRWKHKGHISAADFKSLRATIKELITLTKK